MCEKSHEVSGGGPPRPAPAGAAPRAGVAPVALPGVGGGPALAARTAAPPMRPPERLKKPSTFVLKKSVQIKREEVAPPCECPTSQNAWMSSRPTDSMTDVTMFC